MYCERYSCNMSELACIARRKNALLEGRHGSHGTMPGRSDTGCRGCVQGEAVAKKHNPDEVKAYSDKLRKVRTEALANFQARKRPGKKMPATGEENQKQMTEKKRRGRPAKLNAAAPAGAASALPESKLTGDELIPILIPILVHERDYHLARARALDQAIAALAA